jgi:uncharacterized repeat protein (TIGR02543 family)
MSTLGTVSRSGLAPRISSLGLSLALSIAVPACHEADTSGTTSPGGVCASDSDCPDGQDCDGGVCVLAGGGTDAAALVDVSMVDVASPSADLPTAEDLPAADLTPVDSDAGAATGCSAIPFDEACSCRENADCASGFCVPSGDGGSVCTGTCESGCDGELQCLFVTLPNMDPTYLCVDPYINLCRPCTDDGECQADALGVSGARCIRHGDDVGSFCGVPCEADRDCPDSYACREVEALESGATLKQCVLADEAATCACSGRSVAQAAFTRCSMNRCEGVRVCEEAGLGPCTDPEGILCADVVAVSVTYDPQGGTLTGPASRTLYHGERYGEPPPVAREGHDARGWWTEPGGQGAEVLADTVVTLRAPHTVYAAWAARRYSVSFDSEGGSPCETLEVTFGAPYGASGALCVPARRGYVFGGWHSEDGGTGARINDDTLVATAADHVLYAAWLAEGVTVTFDAAGGSPCDSLSATFGTVYGPLCVTSRPGYVFEGWHEEGGGRVTDASVVSNPDDHTLQARWSAARLTVTFRPEGGSEPQPASASVTFAEPYGLLPNTSRAGHAFGGWWTTPSGAGVEVAAATLVTTPGDHSLHARWSPNRPQVTFDSEGGTPCEPRVVTYGQSYGAAGPLCAPTRVGFTFAGWRTGDDGTGDAVSETTVVTNGDPHVLHARWNANRYTVSFESNGGTPCDPVTVSFRQPYGPLCATTRTGWTFDGWYDSPDGPTVITADSLVLIPANHTLYGRWTVNTVTVSFDSEGGSACAPRTVAYGQAYGASGALCVPARDGYVFAGWFVGDGGTGAPVSNTTAMLRTVSHSLYAGWTAATLTVTYDNAGGAGCGTKQVVHGEAYGPLCVPARVGYTFGGWMVTPESGAGVNAASAVTAVADHTLYARWTADTYVVTFDSAGGSVCAPITVRYGQTYGEASTDGALCSPTLIGNLFEGWYDASGPRVVATTVVTRTQSHTLTARWKRVSYVLTFDAAGGTAPSPATKNVSYGALYGALAITSRVGHAFSGWWTEPEGAGDEIAADTVVRVASAHTLYAAWTPNRYVVSFDAKGGSACADLPVIFGAPYATAAPGGALCVPTRSGHAFGGWYDADTEGANVVADGTLVARATNHTLYARWVTNAYTVTFNPQGGGSPSPSATMPVQFGVQYGTLPTTTRAGYVFSGWWTIPGGLGAQVTATTVVARAESHTLHAHWVPGAFVVTYDNRGGAGCTTHSVVFGDRYGLRGALCTPTLTGNVFAGWHLAESLEGEPVTADTTVTTPGAHTLFARWTPEAYIVSFDAAGGSPCQSITVRYGRAYGESALGGVLCTPTRAGHTFARWVDASGTTVTADTTVAEARNHTLQARWTAQSYGVTFEAGEGTAATPPGKTVTFGQAYGALAFSSRVGYSLAGWRTGPDGAGVEVTAETVVTRAEAHTLYAAWVANRYLVSFDAKGGTPCTSFEATYGAPYGASAPGGALCTPTRTGHTFGGWFDGESEASARVVTATLVTTPGSHTLYARWTANTYNLAFDGGLCASRLVRFGSRYDYNAQTAQTQALCKPTQTGYRFVGWCLDPGCATALADATLVTTAGDHTAYPSWAACPSGTFVDAANTCAPCHATCQTCTGSGQDACLSCTSPAFLSGARCLTCGPDQIRVTYDAQGGTPTPPPDCRTIGAPFGPLASPTKVNHFQTGWFGASSGGMQWTPTTIIPPGSGPMTLFAQWAAGTGEFTVTYNNEGGSGCSTLPVRYGQPYGQLAPDQRLCLPVRNGYTFSGWYTTASGSGSLVTDATPVATMADHSLYARWVITGNEFIVWPTTANVRNDASTRFEITALGGSPQNAMQRYCFEIASGPGSIYTIGNVGTYTPPGTAATNGQQVTVRVWPNDADDDCDDPAASKTEVVLTLVPGHVAADVTPGTAGTRHYTWTIATGSKVDIGVVVPAAYAEGVATGFPLLEADADEDGTLSGTLSVNYVAPPTILGDVAYDVIRWKSPNNVPAGFPSGQDTYLYIRIVKLKAVDLGTSHACAISSLGELKCWGSNASKQLGLEDTQTTNVAIPWQRPWISWQGRRAVSVSAGNDHTCATFADLSATCWGNDSDGELGNGAASTVSALSNASAINLCGMYGTQTACAAESGCSWSGSACLTAGYSLTRVEAGGHTTCGIRSDGKALCWGLNARGTVGNSTFTTQQSPQLVHFQSGDTQAGPALANRVIDISLSEAAYQTYGQTACAVLDDGSGWCWGSDGSSTGVDALGGFGVDTYKPRPITRKPAGRTFRKIQVGYGHSCGILDDNSVSCFGEVLSLNFSNATTQMFTAVSHLAVGAFTNAVVSNGQLKTWGQAAHGSLGASSPNTAYTNAAIPDIGNATVIGLSAAGATYYGDGTTTLALRADGRAMCFGANDWNECVVAGDVYAPLFLQP